MTTSFPRLLSTTASNPTLFRTGSDHLTRSVSNSVTRLLFSSSSTHHHNEKEQTQTPKPESLNDDDKQSQKEEEEEDNDDDIDMNKETGEVGGPKGPEPTSLGNGQEKTIYVSFSARCNRPKTGLLNITEPAPVDGANEASISGDENNASSTNNASCASVRASNKILIYLFLAGCKQNSSAS